jgi:hypothetical protein
MSTALYPATDAWDDSASIDCAREMRGTSSRLNAVTPRFARARTMSAWVAGCKKLISTAPLLMRLTSPIVGASTLSTASASPSSAEAFSTILTPTCR